MRSLAWLLPVLAVLLLVAYCSWSFLWGNSLLKTNHEALVWRDFRRDLSGERLIVPEKRIVKRGEQLRIWGDFRKYSLPQTPIPVEEVASNVEVYFNFDPREIVSGMFYSLDAETECLLDENNNITTVELLGGHYSSPDPSFPTSVARIDNPPLRLKRPLHLAGPAKIVAVSQETWDSGTVLPPLPSQGPVDARVVTVVVPDDAVSGWVCVLSRVRPKHGGKFQTAVLSWSLYSGYVYVK